MQNKEPGLLRIVVMGLLVLACLFCAAMCVVSAFGAQRCGTERWDVKTGQDQWAGEVNPIPRPAAITWLRGQKPPAKIHSFKGRARGVEDQIFRVEASIAYAKREADGDYHVVLVDESGQSVIAEFPDPACVGRSPWKSQAAAARARLEALALRLNARIPPRSRIHCSVTGVGFFDFIHGQTGHAPNGVELHPVLAFEVLK